jgi:hypothetical protein
MTFAPVRNEKKDVVKAGALRLTWISGTLGGIAAILTALNEHLINFFGDNLTDDIKADILIVIIAAWSLIAVADLFTRAITTAARLKAPSAPLVTAPSGMRVKLTDGVDSAGWLVAAIRGGDGAGDAELLIAKSGEAPKWVKRDEVVLDS